MVFAEGRTYKIKDFTSSATPAIRDRLSALGMIVNAPFKVIRLEPTGEVQIKTPRIVMTLTKVEQDAIEAVPVT